MAMLREYETVYVLKPEAGDERVPKVQEKVEKAIERSGGVLLGFDNWGKKKLSYDIQKTNRGTFVQVGFCGKGGIVNEVERELRLDDAVVRHFTLKLAEAVDAEKRQKEYATTKRVRREAPEEDEREDRDYRSAPSEERGYSSRDFEDERGGGDDDES